MLGAPRALFLATTGLLPVLRGTLTVRGLPAYDATRDRRIAGAPLAPSLPPKWTVTDYVEWSARLAGVSAVDARASAQEAIRKLMLGAMAKTELGRVVAPHARRATIVAAALATYAQVIALEDPLGGLPDDVADTYAKVLCSALSGRAWIVFAPRMSITSPLAMLADEAILATPNRIDAQGAPAAIAAAERRFVGRVLLKPSSTIAAAIAAIAARGGRVEEHGAHTFFDLGKTMTTSELFAICAEADVALVELVPVSRALT